jgi:hypothetical protein
MSNVSNVSHLTQLQTFLNKKLDMHRTGGSIFVRDDHTLILTDKDLFSGYDYKLIESKFPNLGIDIVASTGSRSGFLVLFTVPHPYNRIWQRSALRLFLHCACFVCALIWTAQVQPTQDAQ